MTGKEARGVGKEGILGCSCHGRKGSDDNGCLSALRSGWVGREGRRSVGVTPPVFRLWAMYSTSVYVNVFEMRRDMYNTFTYLFSCTLTRMQ